MPQFRKIASNLLWTPQGWVRHPLVGLADNGSVRFVASCPEPDRLAFVEFRAGVLVPDFPADFRAVFEQFRVAPARSLGEWLPAVVTPGRGVLVLISGLDYGTLQITEHSRIERL